LFSNTVYEYALHSAFQLIDIIKSKF